MGAHVPHVLQYDKVLQGTTRTLRLEAEEVNKRRKLDQVSCGNQLRSLARQVEDLEKNTLEVNLAHGEVEADVARLKRFCKERGVLPAEFVEEMDVDAA